MRKKIVGIIICILCILVSINIFSIPAEADSETKIITAIYGSFPIHIKDSSPNFFHIVSGIICNIGKVSAYNVSSTLTITGGFKNNINKTISYNLSELPPLKFTNIGLEGTYGFGPVKIKITFSATNVDTKTRIARGFQIGNFTWIPLTWVIPGVLQNLIPWLNLSPTQKP